MRFIRQIVLGVGMVTVALAANASVALPAPEPLIAPQTLSPGAKTLSVTIHSALERALTTVAPQDGRALAAECARLMRWRGPIAKWVKPGDRIDILYAPPSAQNPTPTLPVLLAMRYRGERLQMQAYRFSGADGIFRYYDEEGQLIEPHMLHAPVPAYEQITEVVQRGRGLRKHRGDDLKAPEGALVVLPFAGQVSRINWGRRYNGRCIEVQLDAGYTAHFLHLRQLDPAVRPGVRLPAGAHLGTVGNTGHSSGAHLHYELLRKHEAIEPLLVHGRRRVTLGPEALTHFVPARDAMVQRFFKN